MEEKEFHTTNIKTLIKPHLVRLLCRFDWMVQDITRLLLTPGQQSLQELDLTGLGISAHDAQKIIGDESFNKLLNDIIGRQKAGYKKRRKTKRRKRSRKKKSKRKKTKRRRRR